MSDKNRMTDERFNSLAKAVEEAAVTPRQLPFVDFKMFCEVFSELKALREERK